MLGFQLSIPAQALRPAGGAAPPAPPAALSAVLANGWSGLWASGTPPTFAPNSAPQTVTLTRAGFDAAGAAVSVSEAHVLTQRVRQTWPNHASLTAATVALSDYVYATDSIGGATNNSVEISPRPIAQWVTPHRAVVGNSIGGSASPVEIVAFHRNARAGRQVAAVKFLIADGTTTLSATVAATVVSGRTGDRNPVLVYRLPATDISTLAPGLITVNAEVYPWIGGTASVARSASDGADARGFSPRYFLKDVTLAANPPYAYVASGGNDGTGVVSTAAATAAASPFLTVLGALNAIHTAFAATSGIDGAVIRVGAGTFVLGGPAAVRTQKVAALTIERDPAVAKAAAIVTFGTAAWRARIGGSTATAPLTTGCVRFNDLTIQRTGTLTLAGEAGNHLELIFDGGVTFDNAANNATYLSASHAYHYGTTFQNVSGASVLGAGTYEHRVMRGVSTAAAGSVEGWCLVGSALKSPSMAFGTRSASGGVVAFSTILDPPSATVMLEIGSAADVNGYAFVQNVVEYISATTNAVFRVSGDNGTGNNSHVVVHHNSFAGAYQAGRWNMMYDEGATPRTSKLMSVVGNIGVAFYTKSDVFRGEASGNPEGFNSGTPSTRTGNWAYMYGVGCQGNFSQFQSNTLIGGNEAQAFPGLGARIGTSQSVRQDALFASYAGTTYNGTTYTAGAGGGAYTLQAGSAARGLVTSAVLSHGLGGTARPAGGDAAGAYA